VIKHVVFALWFFLPAGLANMAPILASRLSGLKYWDGPIDGGATLHGRRLLGPHKTWRGIAAGVVFATVSLWLQQLLVGHAHWTGWLTDGVNYAALPTFLLGPLFGIGALGGDAVESFFKRRRGTAAGQAWFPFDQTDYIIGSILATLPIVQLSLPVYAWSLVLWPGIHLVAAYAGYLLGLKERPI
jgi:CDP-2,3-bis-(O-geranylgeranyl)-sn-glycerol synthase